MSFADGPGYGNGNNNARRQGGGGGGYQGGGGYGNPSGGGGTSGYGSTSNTYQGGGGGAARGGGSSGVVSTNMLQERIQRMADNVNQITKMVNMLGSNKDGIEHRQKLNALLDSTRSLAKDTTIEFKDAQHSVGQSDQQRMAYQKLTKDFQVWVQKFQEIAKVSAQKERNTPLPSKPSQKQDSLPPTTGGGYHDDYVAGDEKQGLIESNRRQQLQALENEREFNDALIAERELGIKQIESTIIEVNEIFVDLSNLVAEQGTMIDNIESNIESTVHHTTEGVVQLRKASENQKAARSKMCWLLLILTIVVGAIAGFFLLYYGVIKK